MPWKPDYLTAADARDFLRIPSGDTVDQVQLASWCTAVSRAIDARCNRQFGQEAAPVLRTYRRPWAYDPSTGLWSIEIDDLMTTTGMTVNGVAFASSGAVLLPDNAPADGRPWERLAVTTQPVMSTPGVPATTALLARWGWLNVPVQVFEAAKLQLNRFQARRDSPYGIGGSPGSELRLLARLDPDVINMLSGLSRRRLVA